jgi:hypothetical protein
METSPEIGELAGALAKGDAKGVGWFQVRGNRGYFVSELGEVWSSRSRRLLRGGRAGIGYRSIMFPDGRSYIHYVVCELFNGPRPSEKHQVRHLDGDLSNNRYDNLAWGTPAQNAADKNLHGTSPIGERNGQARLTRADVIAMRELRSNTSLSFKRIAQMFGVTAMTAHRAITGVSWNV